MSQLQHRIDCDWLIIRVGCTRKTSQKITEDGRDCEGDCDFHEKQRDRQRGHLKKA